LPGHINNVSLPKPDPMDVGQGWVGREIYFKIWNKIPYLSMSYDFFFFEIKALSFTQYQKDTLTRMVRFG
jgi:hypothetical protein